MQFCCHDYCAIVMVIILLQFIIIILYLNVTLGCGPSDICTEVKGWRFVTQPCTSVWYWLVILDGSCRLQFWMLHINTCISLWTVWNYLPATSVQNYRPVPYAHTYIQHGIGCSESKRLVWKALCFQNMSLWPCIC